MTDIKRPLWAQTTKEMQDYYDNEWGIECHDDRQLFEMLSLETYQIGLSWQTVLNKREAFNQAFYHYDIDRVSSMTDEDVDKLLQNPQIIRNRRKLESTIHNAQVILRIIKTSGSFDNYLWSLSEDFPVVIKVGEDDVLPPKTDLSIEITNQLKKTGFKMVGPVTIFSFMQAAGLVNGRLDNQAQ
ncbi:DNA-3-methyladenine glycosylase I [Paucilactobacillus suebicus]|nr:DNA-3-methyladenine glycosylase I [Paucilactobacillus suebicus]